MHSSITPISFSKHPTMTCGNFLHLIGTIWTNNVTCQIIFFLSAHVKHFFFRELAHVKQLFVHDKYFNIYNII